MKTTTTASSSMMLLTTASLFLLAIMADVSHGFIVAPPRYVSPMASSKNPTADGGSAGQCSLKPYNGPTPSVSPLYSTRPPGGAVDRWTPGDNVGSGINPDGSSSSNPNPNPVETDRGFVKNIALNKPASMSSMREWSETPRPASNAVDGRTSGEDTIISHTELGKPGIWSVDLEESFLIDSIVIWNRSTKSVIDQLNNFTVLLFDNNKIVWSEFYADVPNPTATFRLPAGTKGDKVKVLRDDFLQLAEVQVFGYKDADGGEIEIG